ncbi:ATP synthase F1 subunit epsilon [Paludibacteraceae bacterium OttesenSCG-928-F17]|nr:ATP synthase F1 subunit epsilon [Paludibacteraceae bacterium OttesenSCG-928-F17]
MTLEIISPEKILYSGEVEAVMLPGINGLFTILNNHAPIISALTAGKLRYRTIDQEVVYLEIKGGFVEMDNNHITVAVE